MGGFSLGFVLALEDTSAYGIDIDRYAVETYNLNLGRFNCRAERADLLVWEPDGKDFDIIIGGSPCQPFSTANRYNMGAKHPLFPTFRRYFELVGAVFPRVFVFENVTGLLRPRFRVLLEAHLSRLARDYHIKYGIFNAADYGVPQTRLRVIVIGIRRDERAEFVFPAPTHSESGKPAKWVGAKEALEGLENDFIYTAAALGYSDRESIRSADKPIFTILTKFSGTKVICLVWSSGRIKKLGSREGMRFQSFPDWWRFPETVSETRRMRLVGEAVPPILAYRLAIAVGKALGIRTREPPREEEWDLPYFRRAFADYFDGMGGNG
jgi:DNA (cytosine-5)-methyltransferase 1